MGRNFESTAEYTCDDTYTLIGLPQLVCMSNGYWSGSSPKCERTSKYQKKKTSVNCVQNFILGGILSDIRSEMQFYGDV